MLRSWRQRLRRLNKRNIERRAKYLGGLIMRIGSGARAAWAAIKHR